MSADRNLLFAVLALQNDLVRQDDLLAAMSAWAMAKHQALGDLLVERGALEPEDRRALDALIDRQVKRRGSAQASLAALDLSTAARGALTAVSRAEAPANGAGPAVSTLRLAAAGTDDAPAAGRAGVPPAGSRYRVLRPHAKGGLGEVFVAEDTELHREVALKEIQERYAHHGPSRGRFVLEAEVTGRLEHPGVVPVYGLGAYADGRPFYAMRFIRGETLKDAIERFHQTAASGGRQPAGFSSLDFRQLLSRFVAVCNAIAYAHSRGVLHRDLKPANIMLGKFGETLVVDWGLAKAVGRRDADGEEMPWSRPPAAAWPRPPPVRPSARPGS
jgi:tRNA A-37 threonylcarbamoyl transferase component Bud32